MSDALAAMERMAAERAELQARAAGLDPETVERAKRGGRRAVALHPETAREIRELYASGMGQWNIMRRFGVSLAALRHALGRPEL